MSRSPERLALKRAYKARGAAVTVSGTTVLVAIASTVDAEDGKVTGHVWSRTMKSAGLARAVGERVLKDMVQFELPPDIALERGEAYAEAAFRQAKRRAGASS